MIFGALFFLKGIIVMVYVVDCRPSLILFPVSLIYRWYSLEKIKENKEFKEFKKFNFCYRYPLSYSSV